MSVGRAWLDDSNHDGDNSPVQSDVRVRVFESGITISSSLLSKCPQLLLTSNFNISNFDFRIESGRKQVFKSGLELNRRRHRIQRARAAGWSDLCLFASRFLYWSRNKFDSQIAYHTLAPFWEQI